MEVTYRKDLHHNYLVIAKPDNNDDEVYCVYMLQANSIEGIIRPEPRVIDNQVLYYYDITGKQALDTVYVKGRIEYEQLRRLFTKLADLIECSYEYLLSENDLVIAAEHIYIELTSSRIYIAYLPGHRQDIKNQLTALIEYLMNKVDYSDKDAVLYIYNLYAVCCNEGYSFNNLLSAIREEITDKATKREGKRGPGISIKMEHLQEDAIPTDKEAVAHEEPKPKRQIPVMMEKVVQEREKYYYPIRTYIYTGACIIGAIMILVISLNMKLIYTAIRNRIDYGKLFALLLILLIGTGYLMKRIWDKNNRLTKIISRQEYIDPRIEPMNKPQVESRPVRSEQINAAYEPDISYKKAEKADKPEERADFTVLLNADFSSYECYLEPEKQDEFSVINIREFPFVIGKKKENVDFLLDREVVSRFHAKITKEDGSYFITDLNSTNGTTVNDIPLACYQRHKINENDRISIADISYSFHVYE